MLSYPKDRRQRKVAGILHYGLPRYEVQVLLACPALGAKKTEDTQEAYKGGIVALHVSNDLPRHL